MCLGSKAPAPPPPPAPPPAQAPAKASVVDFNAVDSEAERNKKKAAGKKKFRVKPSQNSIGTFTGNAGSGLSIPTKGGNK